MDYEVKAGGLEASFDGFGPASTAADAVASLRGEIAKLSDRMSRMAAGDKRPALDGAKAAADPARHAFVDGYLRKGLENGFEVKKLSAGVGAEGGVAVPTEIDSQISTILKDVSPIRRIATVVQVGSGLYKKLIASGMVASSGWGNELLGSRVAPTAGYETGAASFREITPPMGEVFANPAVSQQLLDDAAFDVEGWLAREIGRDFARLEGTAFVNGDGVNKPRGFMNFASAPVVTGDATRAAGVLQYIPSGVAADIGGPEKLIELVFALRSVYRQGAAFVMNSEALSRVRRMRENGTNGGFLFQPSMVAGTPSTLLGYPIIEAEDMPAVAANAFPIAFGNFQEAYVITERPETGILRDPFTNKPYVHFYATRRVGGALVNSEAIKLLRVATS